MTKRLTQDFDTNCDSGARCSLSTALVSTERASPD